MKKIVSSIILTLISVVSFGQLIVTQTQTPDQLVNSVLTGNGVIITNVTYNYSAPAAQNIQTTIGYFNNNGGTFPIPEGVVMGTGDVILAVGPNSGGASTNNNGVANPDPNDPDLAAISTAVVNNECILEFDFIPSGDTIVFDYVFASEEYPEFSPSNFNDAFGFFISGPGFAGPFSNAAENIAIIPGTSTPVTINNINPTTNPALYVTNAGGADLEYDGHTVVLQAAASVVCGATYHIKLAIGDAGDQSYDSAVFLEANSFSSNGAEVSILPVDLNGDPLVNNELYEGCTGAQIVMVNPAGYTDSSYVVNIVVGGTATNTSDYSTVNPTYTIPPGQDSLTININALADALVEGTETLIISTFYVNECGDTITVSDTINIVDVAPAYNVLTTDTTYTCPFDSLDLSALTDGGIPNLTYNWGAAGNGQTVTVPANIPGLTSYNVTVTDACGTTSQGVFNVTLNAAPVPSVIFNDNGPTICPGQNVTIEIVTINNSGDPGNETFSWTPIAGATNSINVSPVVTTWYYVDMFDGCYTITDSVRVNMGTINITAINVVDALNCPGQPAPVLGSIEILPAMGTWTYTAVGGGFTVGPQASNQFGNLNGNVTYAINVTSSDGCEADTLVFVGSSVVATTADWIQATLDSVTCFGVQDGSAEIDNVSGGLNGGPYDVTWTSQSGETSSLNGVATGSGDVNDTLFGGNWTVTVVEQGSGCAWSETFVIYEPDLLEADVSNSSEPSCFELNDGDITVNIIGGNALDNGTISILNSNGDQLYDGSLTINQLVTDTYTIEIIDNNGCQASSVIFLDEPGQIEIDLIVINPTCFGIPTGYVEVDTVYNYQGSYGDLYYDWLPNPSGNNGIGSYFTNHLGEDSYQLKITDSMFCFRFFDFEIEYPDSIYFSELDYQPTICRKSDFYNGHGQVYVAAEGGSDGNGNGENFSYIWTENATGLTTVNSTWGNRNPGFYTVVATNDLGCVISGTIEVDSLSPEAIFSLTSPDFTSAYEGTAVVDVTIINESNNYAFANNPLYSNSTGVDTSFTWTFGFAGEAPYVTGDINEIINKQYLEEGVYEVCLIVKENLNNCVDTACQEIIIYDFPLLVVPNVFTPGTDGVNDQFFFPNTAIVEFKCSVFDRWGKQIFQFNSIEDTWSGKNMNNDKDCTDGVYFYMYEGTSTNGTEFIGQGNVHLIRN
jgi:gliding motility-associated-like protein